MAKRKVRYRITNKDLIVQVKGFLWGWKDYTNMNNLLYQIDEELNQLAQEMRQLIDDRKKVVDFIASEKKFDERDKNENKGYSAPFVVNTRDLEPIGLNFSEPKQDWRSIIVPKLLGTDRKTVSGKTISPPMRDRGDTHRYTLDQFKEFAVDIDSQAREDGLTGATVYKEPNKKQQGKGKGSNGGGEFNPKNRKKQKGESPEGHQARLDAISRGDDVSGWDPSLY